MKNESESRVSTDTIATKPTAPLITNYKQLILSFVKQMQFDVVILGKKMFTEDKKQNLRNQIEFYKQGFGKNMNDEQAYQELIMLSTSSPQFVKLVKETSYFFIGKNLETEAQINKELNRSISYIESFIGSIKIVDKQIIVNWSVNRQKLYSKTVVDILLRSFLLSYMLEIVIRSAMKLDFRFTFSISIEYTQSCLEKEIEPKFAIEDQSSSYEFKFYK